MTGDATKDWNPGAYHRFRGYRLRPANDLLAAVGDSPEGDIVDLGCGSGAMGAALKARFPAHRLIGVDQSPAMLAAAADTGTYDALVEQDIATWVPEAPPVVIFSNAALHWLPHHERLLPRLSQCLAPGGTLAVQVPHQNNAPSHRVWVSLMDEMFPDRYDSAEGPGVFQPAEYYRMLSGLGQFSLWETDYYQVLPADGYAHPVRLFTEATFARPLLEVLEGAEQAQLIAAYESVMDSAYQRGADGSVLFPFKRMFFTLEKDKERTT